MDSISRGGRGKAAMMAVDQSRACQRGWPLLALLLLMLGTPVAALETLSMGVQPLAMPVGVTTEVMGHDTILAEELADRGYQLQLLPFAKGGTINQQMQAGKLQIATAGDMPTLQAAAEQQTKVVALIKLNFSSLIGREVGTVNELAGRRIAYTRGSTAHYALLQALQLAGLSEDDVELVPMGISDMPSALDNRRVDAFVAWEPTPTIALQQHPDMVMLHRTLNSSYLYFERGFAREHPDLAKLLLAAHIRAVGWMQRSQSNLLQAATWSHQAIKAFQGSEPQLDIKTIARLTREGLLDVAASAQVPAHFLTEKGRLADEFYLLKREGKIASAVTWSDIQRRFDVEWVRTLHADPMKWRLYEFAYRLQ